MICRPNESYVFFAPNSTLKKVPPSLRTASHAAQPQYMAGKPSALLSLNI